MELKMIMVFLKKYKSILLISVFFFYLGSGITLSFMRFDCADAVSTIDPKKTSTVLKKVEYAVLILSNPNYERKRKIIRQSWGCFTSNVFKENGEILYKWNIIWPGQCIQRDFIKIFFVLGIGGLNEQQLASLKEENEKYNDLLLLDNIQDSYVNLTAKMLQAIRWFSDNLDGLKYVIKSDDDSFVRIDLIIRDLDAFAPEMNAPQINNFVSFKASLPTYKGLYWGYFDGRARVNLNGKWEEKDWFLCDKYLPYALGGGYVISRSIIDYIGRNADFLSHYKSEDVSMGVWTAALDGINRVHDIRFDTEWQSRGCNNQMLVRHPQDTVNILEMYRTLVDSQGNKLCKIETKQRKSYLYKWHVLPSVCCRI